MLSIHAWNAGVTELQPATLALPSGAREVTVWSSDVLTCTIGGNSVALAGNVPIRLNSAPHSTFDATSLVFSTDGSVGTDPIQINALYF